MTKRREPAIKTELEALYKAHGVLNPRTVVQWARNHASSALHARFTWDNSIAAERYREWQARELITEVTVIYPDKKERPVFVSRVENRGPAGGYESLVDVMSDAEKRAAYLAQALDEYKRVGAKYSDLKELSGVRAAVDRVASKHGARKAA
jgi:macrodomain Ter protein organizer (MatP/YcbG family)